MSIVNSIPRKPDAVVIFTGLLMVHLDDQNNVCQVGIHPHPDHVLRLKIELRTHGNNLFQGLVWEHTYPKLNQNLHLKVTNPNPDHSGIERYQKRGHLNRSQDDIRNHHRSGLDFPEPEVVEEDYRWALNLALFHRNKLAFRPNLQPHIRLNSGIFFATRLFHLGEGLLSQYLFAREKPIPDHSEFAGYGIERHVSVPGVVTLTAVAQAIGANLYFTQNNGSIALEWEPFSDTGTGPMTVSSLPLPTLNPPPNGSYYKIVFNNDCRNDDGFVCAKKLNRSGYRTDIPLYYERGYNLLEAMPEEGALDIIWTPNGFSRDFPCIPVGGP